MERRALARLAGVASAATLLALGSWLLVADPSLGRGAPGMRQPTAGRGGQPRPLTHGYGGGYSGVCRPARWRPLTGPEIPIRRATVRCFESTGNQTGDNPALSTQAFLADVSGRLTNMTKDTLRCVEGPNEGKPCMGRTDCPAGQCEDMHVLDCAADARGRAVYFIFDGNPTGQNPDLGDELFVFDTKKAELTQLTNQPGWCNGDRTKTCDKASDCGTTDSCLRATMRGDRSSSSGPVLRTGLEVSADRRLVWFLSNGDPGGNPSHALTQFVLVTKGQGKGLKVAGSAGSYCAANTANHGQACVLASDCGAICGDGMKDPTEQCDPGHGYGGGNPTTCAAGDYCIPGGLPDQCTCKTPVCGNGIVEPGEFCDGESKRCARGFTCASDCRSCVPMGSPSSAFLED